MTRPPSRRLEDIVERLWRVEDREASGAAETICPDGCAEIVVHLADAMQGQPRYLLVGQMQAPLTVRCTGRIRMVGARLTPSGMRRLLPLPQHRLSGQIVALDSVWWQWTHRTADQVAGAETANRELDAFEHALEELLPAPDDRRHDRAVEAAWRAMRADGGPLPIERYAQQAGISRRQFERRFRDVVGLSPHLFGRIARFQRAFAALGREPGAALAARLGYVDQAHLIHDVRAFSGQTPTLLTEAAGLTTFFANVPS